MYVYYKAMVKAPIHTYYNLPAYKTKSGLVFYNSCAALDGVMCLVASYLSPTHAIKATE